MDATVLADAGQVGHGVGLWLGPLVISLSLLIALTGVFLASSRRVHPARRKDQSPHRGPMEGGLYRYSPGMYSHSYPPGTVRYKDMAS
ncbi:hypothetical protein [Spirillospora sp. CA-294931]|uniref:hypothetical protein n=1 Tax=Spirillospora sp. CA-294931 TaxID=3240042 RepID=UPI003D901896